MGQEAGQEVWAALERLSRLSSAGPDAGLASSMPTRHTDLSALRRQLHRSDSPPGWRWRGVRQTSHQLLINHCRHRHRSQSPPSVRPPPWLPHHRAGRKPEFGYCVTLAKDATATLSMDLQRAATELTGPLRK